MTSAQSWTTTLSALLTPTIAIFGGIIAYRQWRTAQNKLKFELFDRRLAVYEAAKALISGITRHGASADDELFKFMASTRESKWILNEDLANYLDQELYYKAIELTGLEEDLQSLQDGDEKDQKLKERRNAKKWIREQFSVLDKKFSPFLKLSH